VSAATLDHLARLLAHLRWADALTLRSLRDASSAPARALELYAHVVGAEEVWLSRIEGRPSSVPVWPSLDLDECERLAATTHESLARVVASLDEAGVARLVHYRNSAGLEFDSRLDDILLHVAMHGAWHRGQVATLLRGAGDEPAPSDYIAFVRGTPTATRGDVPVR
jgi:uncharacterized damage-inducible protein DinB